MRHKVVLKNSLIAPGTTHTRKTESLLKFAVPILLFFAWRLGVVEGPNGWEEQTACDAITFDGKH
jgi:hypothetical protein